MDTIHLNNQVNRCSLAQKFYISLNQSNKRLGIEIIQQDFAFARSKSFLLLKTISLKIIAVTFFYLVFILSFIF